MKTSFFTKFTQRPALRLQLEMDAVISAFLGGLHKSIAAGSGFEFKRLRPYDPADNPRVIDDVRAASFSEDPELEPLSREYHDERKISFFFLIDSRESMRVPVKKQEDTAILFWLIALSAFEAHDPLHVFGFSSTEVIVSDILTSEEETEDFFMSVEMGCGPRSELLSGGNIFSHIAGLSLSDAVIIVVSDFRDTWKHELLSLRRLGLSENNISVAFFALDEWAGFSASGYGMTVRDPITDRMRYRSANEFRLLRKKNEEHFAEIQKSVRSLAIPFLSFSLIEDPLESMRRQLIHSGFAYI